MDNPLISVIIPVYNPGEYLIKCLDSVINQTYKNLEIILIDDGSTDGSDKVINEYAKRDSRIVCVHQKNLGVSKARNNGVDIAKGDLIHFPDSDDYIEPDTYEYLLNLIDEHNCDAVAFEHFITFPDKEIIHNRGEGCYGLFDSVGAQKQLVTGCQFCCNKLYKKELIGDIRFREDILRGEDTLFSAEVLKNAKSVWFDGRPLYHYVQSEESACRGVFRPSQFTVLMLYDAYRELYSGEFNCVWEYFLLYQQEVLISLYYDVWVDVNKKRYKKQRKEIFNAIKKYYPAIKKAKIMTKKQKFKYLAFRLSPNFFCLIHKIVHKL